MIMNPKYFSGVPNEFFSKIDWLLLLSGIWYSPRYYLLIINFAGKTLAALQSQQGPLSVRSRFPSQRRIFLAKLARKLFFYWFCQPGHSFLLFLPSINNWRLFKVVLEAKLVIFCTFYFERNIKKYLPQKSEIFRANTELNLDSKNSFSCSK